MAKLPIRIGRTPVLKVMRHPPSKDKLVYIARANKKISYPWGKSAIAYIGTTKSGLKRVAQSAAAQAEKLLGEHGVKELEFYVVLPKPLKKVKTWRKLESGLLVTFRQQFGKVPTGNTVGKGKKFTDELDYFNEDRLRTIVRTYS